MTTQGGHQPLSLLEQCQRERNAALLDAKRLRHWAEDEQIKREAVEDALVEARSQVAHLLNACCAIRELDEAAGILPLAEHRAALDAAIARVEV